MNDSVKFKKPNKADFTYKGKEYYIAGADALFIWTGEYENFVTPVVREFYTDVGVMAEDEEVFMAAIEVLDELYDFLLDSESQSIVHWERL